MSRSIDERIVEMRFDNREFEKNVESTMSLLEKLKDKLELAEAAKSFEELEKNSGKVKMHGLLESADAVMVKFSAMSTVINTAISNITTSVMNMGTNLVKELSINQITSGFDKLTEKAKSVQTIMNATTWPIEDVNAQLDKLMKFTDETSYNFTDMVNNIGKFTNAGVKLDTSVTAMEGIAVWAADAGQGINEASRAMYNLSQALAVGQVKLMDWRSIENANMATLSFKQQVLDAAVALGTLKKTGEDTYATIGKGSLVSATNFNEALSEGWFTSDVLLKTLGTYGEYADLVLSEAEKSGETVTAVMKRLGDAGMEVGARAFRAAQEYRTFTDAIDATRDAVSSGWMQSFETIFGDAEEAKELWSALGNELYDLFAESASERNDLLKEWKAIGGRDLGLEAIGQGWENIRNILDTVKDAFDDLIPPMTAENLYKITKQVADFADKMKLSAQATESLKIYLKLLLLPLKALFTAFKIGAYTIGAIILKLHDLTESFLEASAAGNPFADALKELFGEERYNRLAKALSTIVDKISTSFKNVTKNVKEFVANLRSGNFTLPEELQNLIKALEPFKEGLLDLIVLGFEKLAEIDFTPLKEFGSVTLTFIIDRLKDLANFLTDLLNNFPGFDKIFSNLGDIGSKLGNIVKSVKELGTSADKGSILDLFSKYLPTAANLVGKLSQAVVDFTNKITPAKILTFGFATAMTMTILSVNKMIDSISLVVEGFKDLGVAVTGTVNGIKTFVNNLGNLTKKDKLRDNAISILMIAGAIVAVAAALGALSKVDRTKLEAATKAIVMIAASLGTVAGVLAMVSHLAKDSNLLGMSTVMLSIAGAILILAGAMKVMSTIDLSDMALRLLALGVAIAGIVTTMAVANKILGSFDIKTALSFMAFAAGLAIIAKAIDSLGSLNFVNLTNSLGTLIIVLDTLIILGLTLKHINGKGNFGSAAALLLMCVDILALAAVLKKLAAYDFVTILKGVLTMVPIGGAIVLLMAALRVGGESARKNAGAILKISAALILLGAAINLMADISLDKIVKATGAISALITTFGLFSIMSKSTGKYVSKAGTAILAMSAAMILLSLVVDILGDMELSKVVKGTAAVSALLVAFSLVVGQAGKMAGANAQAKASLIAMVVAIGILSSAVILLSLIPVQEALGAATSLSLVLVAFGACVKLLNNTVKVSTIFKSLAVLVPALIAIGLFIDQLKEINPGSAVGAATGLSEALIAFSIAMKILSNVKFKSGNMNYKMFGAMFGAIIVICAGLVVAMHALKDIDGPQAIAQMTALSLSLVAVSGAGKIISTMSTSGDWSDFGKKVAILGIAIGALVIVAGAIMGLAAIGNPSKDIADIIAITALLVASVPLVAAAVVLGKVMDSLGGSIDVGTVVQATGVVLVIVAALAAVIAEILFLCNLVSGYQDQIDAGLSVLIQIGKGFGTAIGEFIGGMVGGVATGVMSGVGKGLTEFWNNASGFFEGVKSVDSDTLKGVTNLALALIELTAAEFINNIVNFISAGGASLEKLGKQLSLFAPGLENFANAVGGKSSSNLLNAAEACEHLGNLMKSLAEAQSMFSLLTGSVSLEHFGNELADFGPKIADFAMGFRKVDASAISKANSAVEVVSVLEKSLSQHGGLLQKITGESSLGEFGDSLVAFANGMVKYSMALSGKGKGGRIDTAAIIASKEPANALIEIAKTIPPQNDSLVTMIAGKQDLATFGESLVAFGTAMSDYSSVITGKGKGASPIDTSAIVESSSAAKAIVEVARLVPSQGGFLQEVFGSQSFTNVGEGLSGFGYALSVYSSKVAGDRLSPDIVDKTELASGVMTSISNSINAYKKTVEYFSGEDTFYGFQTSMINFSGGLYSYYSNIKDVSWRDFEASISALEHLISATDLLKDWDGVSSGDFKATLASMAEVGISSFVTSFENADIRMAEAIENAVFSAGVTASTEAGATLAQAFVASVNTGDNSASIEHAGESVIQSFRNGLTDQIELDMYATGSYALEQLLLGATMATNEVTASSEEVSQNIIEALKDALGIENQTSNEFYDIGVYVVDGIIRGMNAKSLDLKKAVRDLGKTAISTMMDTIDAHSPSKEFYKIAGYMVDGLDNGLIENQNRTTNTVYGYSKSILTAFQDYFDINSPSTVTRDEVGRYIVQGIAEGITTDMSAIEAAEKLASNIVSAFKTTLDKISLDTTTVDLQYSLWEKTAGLTASQGEITNKQVELLSNKLTLQAQRVSAAEAEYKATVMAIGATAEQTQEAYNKWLQEQINMADLAAEMSEARGNTLTSTKESMDEYYNWLSENMEYLQSAGFSDEKILAEATRRTGFDPESLGKNKASNSVTDIISEYMSAVGDEVEVVLIPGIADATSSAISSGVSSGLSSALSSSGATDYMSSAMELLGTDAADAFAKTFNAQTILENIMSGDRGLASIASMIGESSIANAVLGVVESGSGYFDQIADYFAELFGFGPQEAVAEANDSHSPSKVYYSLATDCVDGFALGITENGVTAEDAMSNMANGLVRYFTSGLGNEANIISEFIYRILLALQDNESAYLSVVSDVLMKVAMDVVELDSTYYDSGKSIGDALVDGMIQAVEDGTAGIVDAVYNAAAEAYNQALTSMGISFAPKMPLRGDGSYSMPGTSSTSNNVTDAISSYSKVVASISDNNMKWWESDNEVAEKIDELILQMKSQNDIGESVQKVIDMYDLGVDDAMILTSRFGNAYTEKQAQVIAQQLSKNQDETNQNDSGIGQGGSSKNVVFNQYNYSPESLSRVDIYRDTKNQLAMFKGGLDET